MNLQKSNSFTLTEVLIALVLMSLVILAAASIDITSRKFFGTSSGQSQIQDEAKVAMEHIVKYVQQGIGDMSNPGTAGELPTAANSRGICPLSGIGTLAPTGSVSRLQVKIDGLHGVSDGRFDPNDTNDGIVEYEFTAGVLRFYPNVNPLNPSADRGSYEIIARNVQGAAGGLFSLGIGASPNPNKVFVQTRFSKGSVTTEQFQTFLYTEIVARAMSIQ